MVALEVVFWVCFLLVAHTYLVYPLLLLVASSIVRLSPGRRRSPDHLDRSDVPEVSLIIPAYNEERYLREKLLNLRELEYPKDALEILFVSDGSTDGTNEILQGAEGGNVRALYLPERRGKATALNEGVRSARHGLLILTDAATLLAPDAIRKLVRHFGDPRLGVVCGALQFEAGAESRQTEGVYWRYESMLRRMESSLGVSLNASGAIYAIRRECFEPVPADTLIEDLVVPLGARRRGFCVAYDPEATAIDFAPPTVGDEFTRRVRIATGSFRALGAILRARLDPLTAFAFLSHKVLRWFLPFFLAGMLGASAALVTVPLYRALFAAQLAFYVLALAGYVFRRWLRGVRYAMMPYYLTAMHVAFLVGFFRFVTRSNTGEWRRIP